LIAKGAPGADRVGAGRADRCVDAGRSDRQIQTIRTVINPDKLGHVGPVADAWAVAREVNRARRSTERPDDATT
jgi:hypothetical protein